MVSVFILLVLRLLILRLLCFTPFSAMPSSPGHGSFAECPLPGAFGEFRQQSQLLGAAVAAGRGSGGVLEEGAPTLATLVREMPPVLQPLAHRSLGRAWTRWGVSGDRSAVPHGLAGTHRAARLSCLFFPPPIFIVDHYRNVV